MGNRAGRYVDNLSGDMKFFSFQPAILPPNPPINYDGELIGLIAAANRSLGILNAISRSVPDIDLFVSMYIRKEALLSSQIEGTQATIDDILDPDIKKNTNQDIEEVLSYIKATDYAIEKMSVLPICNRLIKEIHGVLMSNSRGEEKTPGEFRRSQNWIGPMGGSLKEARYIPPNVLGMRKAMSELEIFINQNDVMDPLIKVALIHYQFETIHPFLDGNGRIGRLLITLYLMYQKLLDAETLYISYYLKKYRSEYYNRLNEVRDKGNYEQWLKFLLRAVDESAVEAVGTIEKLQNLHNINLMKLNSMKGREGITIRKVFRYIEHSPIINITKTSIELGLSFNATAAAIERLINMKVLKPSGDQKRNRVFIYDSYMEILKRGT